MSVASVTRCTSGGPPAVVLLTLWMMAGCGGGTAPSIAPAPAPAATATAAATTIAPTCDAPGDAYLRARVRGAADLDIDWTAAKMTCTGGPRPGTHGLRASVAGQSSVGSLRFIFGMPVDPGKDTASAVPTNVTIIFEGAQRIFATQGEDKCTTDEVHQTPLDPPAADGRRAYRIEARGFCTQPAAPVAGAAASGLLVTRFDLVARVNAEEDPETRLQAVNGATAPSPDKAGTP